MPNMPTPDEKQLAKFHYKEGNKFGLEFARSLFLFSSALVVALIGYMSAKNPNQTVARWIEDAIMWFSFVWIASIIIFALGYIVNLFQGNAYADQTAGYWELSYGLHVRGIYPVVAIVIVLLIVGFYCLFMAARAIQIAG
jgi:heme/copper-type cytochrome/quinol oxidase subunit 2